MDAYIEASRTYYISAEEDPSERHCTVKFFARRPEAAVDAAQRWQTNRPVAVIAVDTDHSPYDLHSLIPPPTGAALADLFDAAARGAARRQQSHQHG